jgi:hypothetical protein
VRKLTPHKSVMPKQNIPFSANCVPFWRLFAKRKEKKRLASTSIRYIMFTVFLEKKICTQSGYHP